FAPGPWIVRLSVTLSWPVLRGMVPVKPEAKATVSAPGLVLAAAMAARSEPAPLSSRLVTLNVLGTVRSSSTSRRGTKEGRGVERETGTRRGRQNRVQNNMIRSLAEKAGLRYNERTVVRARRPGARALSGR